MEILNEFKKLEQKLTILDDKIQAKKIQIDELFKLDLIKINKNYDIDIIQEHINGLNTQRDYLINGLLNKRNKQLNLVNSTLEEKCNSSNINFEFKCIISKSNEIKNDLMVLKVGSCCDLNLFLNKFNFTKPLDLTKLLKYSDLCMTRKKIDLNLDENHQVWYINQYNVIYLFYNLDWNKLLVKLKHENKPLYQLLIINNKGAVLHSKDFDTTATGLFKVSSKNIFHLFENECRTVSFLQIFDFKLNLIHTLTSENMDFYSLYVHSNELMCTDYRIKRLFIFNVNNLHQRYENIERYYENDLKSNTKLTLMHFNNENLYFYNDFLNFVYICSRKSFSKVSIIHLESRVAVCQINFDQNSNIYFYSTRNKYITMYNENGLFIKSIELCGDKYKYFYTILLTPGDTIVYNQDIPAKNHQNIQSIKYNEY